MVYFAKPIMGLAITVTSQVQNPPYFFRPFPVV
ncbi:hypothetical protein MTY_0545 [Moorella thermoacetica Y72]|uniref:Uncharacterized protein n=1 Tax=Moorella thermoacetica Y72 TaxID=1325331 RepID=A0A0S6U9U5_NEOTH|nr:hypothetical protein MTY_0545 [Moorella thermoacetica Y72]